jgi:transcriptional regulator with XRE-family HTH domain
VIVVAIAGGSGQEPNNEGRGGVTSDAVKGQSRPVRSLAEKLTWLFENVRRPNGRKHTLEEVANFVAEHIGGHCSRNHISMLANGQRVNPSMDIIEGLAAFFDISPAYFVDDDAAQEIQAQLELAVAMRDGDVRAVALRAVTTALAAGRSTISVEGLREVHDLIRRLSTASAPAPQDSRDDPADQAALRNGHHPG